MLLSFLAFVVAWAKRLFFGPRVDLAEVRRLEASLYHNADSSLGYVLGRVNKINGENLSTEATEFLVRDLKRLNKEFSDAKKSLFEIAPKKLTVFSIYIDLRRLDILARRIVSARDGTQIATLVEEIGIISTKLKGNLNRLFKKETTYLFVPLANVLKAAVRSVCFDRETTMKETGIQIKESYHSRCEAARISFEYYQAWKDILSNIVRNAVEAVERLTEDADERKQRRTVFVTMTGGNRSDDLCQIIIEDQGVGMSREILRVFYKRGFSKGKPEGHGLGVTEDKIEFIKKFGNIRVDSKLGEGTSFRITIRRETVSSVPSYTSVKRRAVQILILAAFGTALAFLVSYMFKSPDPNPQKVEKGENYIRILGGKDRLISQHNFPVTIIAGEECWEIVDLDDNGKNEVLFAVWTEDRLDTLNGTLICFNNNGEERWRTKAIERTTYLGDSTHFAYHNTFVDVHDLGGEAGLRIVTSYHADFPARQQIKCFSAEGDLIGEYFHQGVLGQRLQLDADKDGRDEIVLAGTNNQLAGAVIVVVDPENLRGVSPPHTGERSKRFQAGKMRKGTAKYYIRLPLTEFCKKTKSDGSCCSELLKLSDSTFKAGTQEHPFEQISGMHYFFCGLHVSSVGFGPQFENLWRSMGPNLGSPLPNIREYCEKLKCGVEYYEGQHWVAQPCVNKNYLELVEKKSQPRAASNP